MTELFNPELITDLQNWCAGADKRNKARRIIRLCVKQGHLAWAHSIYFKYLNMDDTVSAFAFALLAAKSV